MTADLKQGTFNFKLWLEHREFRREWLEMRLERGRQGQIKVMSFKRLWSALKQESLFFRRTVLVAAWKKD